MNEGNKKYSNLYRTHEPQFNACWAIIFLQDPRYSQTPYSDLVAIRMTDISFCRAYNKFG